MYLHFGISGRIPFPFKSEAGFVAAFAFLRQIPSCFGNNTAVLCTPPPLRKETLLGANAVTMKEDNAEGRIPPGSHNEVVHT